MSWNVVCFGTDDVTAFTSLLLGDTLVVDDMLDRDDVLSLIKSSERAALFMGGMLLLVVAGGRSLTVTVVTVVSVVVVTWVTSAVTPHEVSPTGVSIGWYSDLDW